MKSIGVLILAGGKAKRIGGIKKYDLKLGNKSFFEIILEKINFFDEIIISSNDNFEYFKNQIVIADKYKDCGPISGIYTALSVCKSDALFVLACDMPFINKDLIIRFIDSYNFSYDAMIAVNNGKIQPLFGVYNKRICGYLEKCILNNDLKLKSILSNMNVKYLEINDSNIFANINTFQEYEKLCKNLSEEKT